MSEQVSGCTHFVIGTCHFIAQLELTFLQVTDMQNITVVYLNVGDFKVCFTINGDGPSVILLTSRFGVKVCLVEQQTKGAAGLQFGRAANKLGLLVDGLDVAGRVAEYYEVAGLVNLNQTTECQTYGTWHHRSSWAHRRSAPKRPNRERPA